MDPVTATALISAGTTTANAFATGNMNRRNREFSREMYDRQYQDNIAFWNMQNEYNDPANQMKRLKNAGLNPHLVYGQSSGGASGQASNINSPDVVPYQHRSADYSGLGDAARTRLHDIADLDIKKAQYDNLKTDNTNKIKLGLIQDIERLQKKFDYKQARKLEQVNADITRQQLKKIEADTEYTLGRNEREAAMNTQNIFESLERVYKMRVERDLIHANRRVQDLTLKNIRQDIQLKQLDINLRKMGLDRSSPWYAKLVAQHLDRIINYTKNK